MMKRAAWNELRVITKFMVLAALVFAPAPSSADAVPGVTDTEVLIGAHTNESGKFAQFATFSQGMSAYYDLVNESGGIHGRKIKLLRADCQGDYTKCLSVTKELVERKNVFAMAGSQGQQHIAVYKYLVEKDVPDVFFSDGTSEYLSPQKKTVFPGWYPWDTEGAKFANYFLKHHAGKRVCFAQMLNPMGEEYVAGAMKVFTKAIAKNPSSIKIGATLKLDKNAIQADSEILKLKEDKCEVVLNTATGTLTASMLNYAIRQGFKPIWSVQSSNVNPKFISLLPEGQSDGIVAQAHMARASSMGAAGWAEFEKLMIKKNLPTSGSTGSGFATAQLITEAFRRAGRNLTRENFMKAIEGMKGYQCPMCLSVVNVTPENHWSFSGGLLLVTKGGAWVPL